MERAIDLVGSAILTLFSLPLMAVISLLIVMESGFPAFFFQRKIRAHRGLQLSRVELYELKPDKTRRMSSHCCLATNSELRKE